MSDYKCNNCGSYDVEEVWAYEAYVKEGDFIRLRRFFVRKSGGKYVAECPERGQLSEISGTPRSAVLRLKEVLTIP